MSDYTSDDIQVLEGLEPVRRRPGMYIGGTDAKGYHHLLWEIVDNSVDEAINGFATTIEVTLHADHQFLLQEKPLLLERELKLFKRQVKDSNYTHNYRCH